MYRNEDARFDAENLNGPMCRLHGQASCGKCCVVCGSLLKSSNCQICDEGDSIIAETQCECNEIECGVCHGATCTNCSHHDMENLETGEVRAMCKECSWDAYESPDRPRWESIGEEE